MFVLVLCVSVAIASLTTANVVPPRCCLPHQYTATIFTQRAPLSLDSPLRPQLAPSRSRNTYQIDYNAKLIYSRRNMNLTQDGQERTSNLITLQDFLTGKFYVLGDYGCLVTTTVPISVFPRCIPADASYLGEKGAHGDHAWTFTRDGHTSNVVFTHDCVPVIWAINGDYLGHDQQLINYFSDFSAGLEDPSKMAQPTGCVTQDMP